MSKEVYDLRKKFVKHQIISNEELDKLSADEIRFLCRLLVQDMELAYDQIKVRRVKPRSPEVRTIKETISFY